MAVLDKPRLSRWRLDHLTIATFAAPASPWRSRVPALLAPWRFLTLYARSGEASVRRADATTTVRAGDIVVLPSCSSLDISGEQPANLVLVAIPKNAAPPDAATFTLAAGEAISTRTGTAKLVAQLLHALADQPEDYAPQRPGKLAQHIVGMLALMCAERAPIDGSQRDLMLQKAKDYIEAHLGELDLGPERIAAALNVSTRTLHRLFERDGDTISGWIRKRRLEQCRVELRDSSDSVPVSGIGAKWGLYDAAHFSRLFKANYGLSPRAYRAVHRGHNCDDKCFIDPHYRDRERTDDSSVQRSGSVRGRGGRGVRHGQRPLGEGRAGRRYTPTPV